MPVIEIFVNQKISKKWFVSFWVQNAFSRRRLELKFYPYMLKIKFAADALIRKEAFKKYVRSKIRSNPYRPPPPSLHPLFVPVCFTCSPSSTYLCFSESLHLLSKEVPRRLWIFEWKIGNWKEKKELVFL